MSAHMLDAFFRMEHAPMRPLLQQASDAIIAGNVPIQPQVGYVCNFHIILIFQSENSQQERRRSHSLCVCKL